jgi:hypothetical protein
MATYKVLQDIEAEDKLLGPLTLKQFVFAAITIGIGFVEFKLATTSGLGFVRGILMLVFFFPMAVFGFLAAPISRDQPNDIWLIARLRYLLKPRIRIWNQDGISQLVTITVPKKIEHAFTNNLSQTEVKSRLSALANTLDSRGWAVKNVNVNLFAQPGVINVDDGSDRLVAPSNLPTAVTGADVQAADDMMDPHSNPTARHLDQMVQASTQAHRDQVKKTVQDPSSVPTEPPADYWFLNQPSGQQPTTQGYATFHDSTVVTPGSDDSTHAPQPTDEEKALIKKIEAEKERGGISHFNSHIKTILPLSEQKAKAAAASPVLPPPPQGAQTDTKTQTATPNPAILNLANNDDLNVATIARQAKRISEADDEVVISLH